MRRLSILLAAALAATIAPAHAAPRARTHAGGARAAWVAEHGRLARRLPLDPAFAAAEFGFDFVALAKAGDVNRDGGEDFADIRDHLVFPDDGPAVESMRIDLHRGSDGTLLWTKTLPDACYVFPIFTTVGADGRPGMVVVSYTCQRRDTDHGGAGAAVATVTAYDGSGASVWEQRIGGASSGFDNGYGGVYSYVDGVLDANAGGGLEILAEIGAGTEVWDDNYDDVATAARLRLVVLDGATGTPRDVGALVASERDDIWVYPVGDLNKDKRADIVATSTASGKVVATAVESATGTTLWTYSVGSTSQVGSGWDVDVRPLRDATGDGVADVAFLSGGGGYFGPPSAGGAARAALVNGSTGRAAWTKTASDVTDIGDADRHRGVELVVSNAVYGSARGFTATAYTGSGRKVWSVTRTVRVSDLKAYGLDMFWGPVGDVHADGVVEYGYSVVAQGSNRTRRDEGTVNGRTGRVTKDTVKGLYATTVAIDGHGADAYTRTVTHGVLGVAAYRGDTGAPLWRVAVAAGGFAMRTLAAYANGDRCGDLVISLTNGDSYTDVALSGATGKPMWALTRTALGTVKVTKPSARSYQRYRKTC